MSWNHRILAYEETNGEIYLAIHEVYYDKKGKANGYTENPISVHSDSVKGMRWVLNKMKEATSKPILWSGEKFPKIYKPKNK